MNTLQLLEISQRFTITKNEDNSFDIESKKYEVGASIDIKSNVTFYRTNCYNSGSNWLDIDIEGLNELQTLCELILKQEEM
jgi:hypothetical protein